MKLFAMAIFTLISFFYLPCSAATPADDKISEVPFSFEAGYVIIKARIKIDEPVEMILSTGSEHSIVDTGLAGKYKLPGYYTGEGVVTGRNDSIYFFSDVPQIRVGDIKLAKLNMRSGTLEGLAQKVGRPIFGLLGADFFKGRIVQFDFVKKVVRFLPQSPASTTGGTTSGAAPLRVTLPMRFYQDGITLPIVDNVYFNGKKIKTLLDTGKPTVISLSSSAAKEAGLSPASEKEAMRTDNVGLLRLDNYEITDVPVLLFAKGSSFDKDMKEFGAIAGVLLLQSFDATFDFRKGVVILQRN